MCRNRTGGLDRAALRGGQTVARPAPVPPPRLAEGEHREPAHGGRAEPQALAGGHRLGPPPCPLRRPDPTRLYPSHRQPPPWPTGTLSSARTLSLVSAPRPSPAAFVTGLARTVTLGRQPAL